MVDIHTYSNIFVLKIGYFLIRDLASPNRIIAGFGIGLWHGMITPITLVTSLFSNNVSIYEIHNNGSCYNCGFVLGVRILFG